MQETLLNEAYPDEYDALHALHYFVEDAYAACDQLESYGDLQTDAIDPANGVFGLFDGYLATAETAIGDAEDDRAAILDLVRAAPDLTPADQFKVWVESFEKPTPTDDGMYASCGVEGTRDTTYDVYDYFIWYLVGDCMYQNFDFEFKKSNSWWEKYALEYTGALTERTLADRRGQRKFNLNNFVADAPDRIAFAVEKSRVRSFKPKSPRGIDMITKE